MKIPRLVEDALDLACGLAGMMPPEQHGYKQPVDPGNPRHDFWRMSSDGSRFLAIGGGVYAFQLQLGRLSLNVDTLEEELSRKTYSGQRRKNVPDSP